MRVLFVCPYPPKKAPSQRFRFEQYLDGLDFGYRQEGFWRDDEWPAIYRGGSILYKVLSTMRGFLRRFFLLFRVGGYDIVFIHREATPIGPPWFEWCVAKVWRKPIIYDFDDAIWLPNSSDANAKIVGSLKSHGKVGRICGWARTVVVGNGYLEAYASRFCDSTEIVPTTIDLGAMSKSLSKSKPTFAKASADESSTYAKATADKSENECESSYAKASVDEKERDNSSFEGQSRSHSTLTNPSTGRIVQGPTNRLPTIGWTGTHSTLKQLEPLFSTLEAVYEKIPFRFLLIADQALDVMPSFVEFRPWRKETEIADLMEIDIGVMPLFDTEWEKGKCGFKALQYMALGIPTVVSGVGVNVEIVEDGVSGLICEAMESNESTYAGWKERLEELLVDGDLRRALGEAGEVVVRERYSVEANRNVFYRLFELLED